jgi:putative sugar O-methyltransferase
MKIVDLLKKFLRQIKPYKVPTLSSNEFKKWWSAFQEEYTIDDELKLMINNFISKENINNTSIYWNALSKQHIISIINYGIENFKQTIESKHYFGEGNVKLLKPIIHDKVDLDIDQSELNKKYEFIDFNLSIRYNNFTLILLNYLLKKNMQNYLNFINEDDYGNPIYITYKEKKHSFSSLNSIIEIDVIKKNLDLDKIKSIFEIGAGSGRTCSSLIKIKENLRYTICDIPPTLFISQTNIQKIFPKKKIFKYRPFKNYQDIKYEFEKADIKFIQPEQIQFLPDKIFDLSIAIDCLHEMNKNQVFSYFDTFNRLSSYLYFKCQNVQWAKFDDNKFTFDNYPIKKNWNKILHKKCFIPNDYFDAIYKINN